MAKLGKLSRDLHIQLAELGDLSASDLLAIKGPKFITSGSMEGARTFAVLISRDKWKTLNHKVPEVNPHAAEIFFVDEQAYLVVPVEKDEYKCWSPLPETMLDIVTRKEPRKRTA